MNEELKLLLKKQNKINWGSCRGRGVRVVVNEELKLLKTMPKKYGGGEVRFRSGGWGQGGWNEELKLL